jgi:hypothetical protein
MIIVKEGIGNNVIPSLIRRHKKKWVAIGREDEGARGRGRRRWRIEDVIRGGSSNMDKDGYILLEDE